MKTLFIEAKKKSADTIYMDNIMCYKNIGLFYTVQFKPLFEKIKKQLESKGKKVFSGKSSLYEGQIIGCNTSAPVSVEKKVECFVLLTSGKFHALSLSLNVNSPIYTISNKKLERIPEIEINLLKQKRKAAVSKFILADNIGIIVSIKHGQNNMLKALEIKNKLKKKNVFIFIAETIDKKELENFKIDSWINTACPGLMFDIPNMINLSEYNSLKRI